MPIDPKLITTSHAEAVLDLANRHKEDGTLSIGSFNVDWWCDGTVIWFYEPGNDGENTIKRFEVERQVYEV